MKTVFYDLETTGLELTDAVIQIAAVAMDGPTEVGALERKIAFDKTKANPRALEVNHYTDERWANAIDERDAVSDVYQFFQEHAELRLISARSGRPYTVARIGGHNIAGFDNPRLGLMFKRWGVFCPVAFSGCLDTLQGAAWYFARHPDLKQPQNFQQSTLARYFGVDVDGIIARTGDSKTGEHDALVDVRICAAMAPALLA